MIVIKSAKNRTQLAFENKVISIITPKMLLLRKMTRIPIFSQGSEKVLRHLILRHLFRISASEPFEFETFFIFESFDDFFLLF